jgi:hypothetical protein
MNVKQFPKGQEPRPTPEVEIELGKLDADSGNLSEMIDRLGLTASRAIYGLKWRTRPDPNEVVAFAFYQVRIGVWRWDPKRGDLFHFLSERISKFVLTEHNEAWQKKGNLPFKHEDEESDFEEWDNESLGDRGSSYDQSRDRIPPDEQLLLKDNFNELKVRILSSGKADAELIAAVAEYKGKHGLWEPRFLAEEMRVNIRKINRASASLEEIVGEWEFERFVESLPKELEMLANFIKAEASFEEIHTELKQRFSDKTGKAYEVVCEMFRTLFERKEEWFNRRFDWFNRHNKKQDAPLDQQPKDASRIVERI